MAFEGTADGEAESGVYEMDVETVRDPFAQRIVIQGGFAGDGFESVQIGDRRYVVFGEGQCISSSTDEGDAMDAEVFEPDDVIGGLEDARRVRLIWDWSRRVRDIHDARLELQRLNIAPMDIPAR